MRYLLLVWADQTIYSQIVIVAYIQSRKRISTHKPFKSEVIKYIFS